MHSVGHRLFKVEFYSSQDSMDVCLDGESG